MPLSFEQFKELRNKGLSIDQINRFETGEVPQQTSQVGQTPQIQERFPQPPGAEAIGQFGAGVIKSITTPFARAGVTIAKPFSAIGKGLGGDIAGMREELQTAKPVKIPFLGDIKPVGTPGGFSMKGALDTLGTGAEIASTIAGGFGAKKAVEKGVLGMIGGAMKLGAKTGALFGGLGSFGRSLQEEEPTVTGTLAQTGIGAGIGAIGGAVMGGALATPFALGKAAQPNAAMKRLETEYSRILNLTQKQLQTEDKFAKNSAKFIADELVPLEVKGGRLDTSVAREMLGTKYSSESKAFQNILDDSSEYINFSQFARNAAKQIKEKGTAQYSAINHLRKELSAYASQFGQGVKNEAGDLLIPVGQFNRIKQDLWSKTKWTTESEKLFAQLNYRVGHTAKEMIESAIEDANVKVFNSRLGDFAAALNILEKRHGAVAPGGRMGQYFASLIGAVAGSKGGPIGTVTGAMTGRKLAELLQNPKVTTYFSRKLVDTLVKEGKQDVVDEAMKIITQRTIMRSSRLKLPIPSFIAGHPYKGSMSSFIPESARTKPFIHKLPIKQP